MSAMVKKVARAIWNIRRIDEDRCDMELEDMGDDHEVWAEARAAIEAMKEPTPKMEDSSYLNSWEANEVWGDMIQAALEEGQ